MRLFLKITVVVMAVVGISGAQADPITVTAIDSGWYVADGPGDNEFYHDSSNENYIASSSNFRNFVVFDLSGLSGEVDSAILQLYVGAVTAPYAPDLYQLFDVTSDVGTLIGGGNNLQSVWNDLGSGDLFGSVFISEANENDLIEIVLSSLAIEAINDNSGLFAIGGVFGQYYDQGTSAFGSTGQYSTRNLLLNTVTVPEPGTLALLVIGLAALGLTRRRKRTT